MKKNAVAMLCFFGTSFFAMSEGQSPECIEFGAPEAIKAIPKRIRDAKFGDKAVLDALVECEQTAKELRHASSWMANYLHNRNPAVRQQALQTIAAIGDADSVPLVMKALDDADDDVKVRAAITLEQLPPDRSPVPKLIELTKHKNPAVRGLSVRALGRYAIYFREAMAPVFHALEDNEPIAKNNPHTVRSMALMRLRFCGAEAKEAAPRIVRLIEKAENHDEQYNAASALAQIAPGEPIIVATAMSWLKEGRLKPVYRNHATGILTPIGQHAKGAVPDLVACFEMIEGRKDVLSKGINRSILEICQKLGPNAREALPILMKIVVDSNDPVFRDEVEKTIKAIHTN